MNQDAHARTRWIVAACFTSLFWNCMAMWPLECRVFTGSSCQACIDAQLEWRACKWCPDGSCVRHNTPSGVDAGITCSDGSNGTALLATCPSDALAVVFTYPKYDETWHAHGHGNGHIEWHMPYDIEASSGPSPLLPGQVTFSLRRDDIRYGPSRLYATLAAAVPNTAGALDVFPVPTWLTNADDLYILYEISTVDKGRGLSRSTLFTVADGLTVDGSILASMPCSSAPHCAVPTWCTINPTAPLSPSPAATNMSCELPTNLPLSVVLGNKLAFALLITPNADGHLLTASVQGAEIRNVWPVAHWQLPPVLSVGSGRLCLSDDLCFELRNITPSASAVRFDTYLLWRLNGDLIPFDVAYDVSLPLPTLAVADDATLTPTPTPPPADAGESRRPSTAPNATLYDSSTSTSRAPRFGSTQRTILAAVLGAVGGVLLVTAGAIGVARRRAATSSATSAAGGRTV